MSNPLSLFRAVRSNIRRYFAPPVFTDEDQTRAAAMLNTLLLTFVGLMLAGTVIALTLDLFTTSHGPFTVLLLVLAALVSRAIVRRGKVRLAALLISTAVVIAATFMIFNVGTIRTNLLGLYVFAIIIPTSLVGPRAGLAFTVFSSLAVFGLLQAELANRLPSMPPPSPIGQWILFALLALFAFAALSLARQSVLDALASARRLLAERQRAETALRRSEQLYRALAHNFPNGAVLMFDHDLRYIAVGGQGLEAVGFTREALEGKTIWEALPPETSAQIEPHYRAALNGQVIASEASFRGRLYQAYYLPARDDQGTIVAGMVMTQDITAGKQAEAQLKRQTARLELLHEIDLAILELKLPEATAQAALDKLRGLIGCQRAGITLFDFEANEALALAVSVATPTRFPAGTRVRLDDFELLPLEALREQRQDTLEDVLTMPRIGKIDSALAEEGIRAWLMTPLLYQGELIGSLNLGSATPGPFDSEHIEIAREVATQIAIAIQQSQLFAQTSAALAREQIAHNRAGALLKVSQAVSSTLSLPDVLQRILDEAKRALPYVTGSIVVYAENEASFMVVGGYTEDKARIMLDIHRGLRDSPILSRILRDRETISIPDVRLDSDWVFRPDTEHVRAWLGVPLISHDNVAGVLALDSDTPGAYQPHHVEYAESLAAQAAIAIRNAQLFEAEQEARKQAEVLRAANLALTESLELDSILNTLLDYLGQLVPYDSANVMLVENDNQLHIRAIRGYEKWADPEAVRGLTFKIDQYPNLRTVINTRQSFSIPNTAEYGDWVYTPHSGHIRSWLGTPLAVKGKVIGLYSLDKAETTSFTDAHIRLTEALAAQAAIVIQNARLFEATRRQLSELAVLHAIAVAATDAQSEDALLEHALRIISEDLYSYIAAVMLLDPATNELRFHPATRGVSETTRQITLPLGKGVVGTVAARGQPMRVPDVNREPAYFVTDSGTLSELCVPLKIGEHLSGVLYVESRQLNAYDEADERLLLTIAGQLASAIERLRAEAKIRHLNAELEQRVTARSRELAALYDVSAMTGQLLAPSVLLEHVLVRVLEAVRCQAGVVHLLGETSGALEVTAQRGLTPHSLESIQVATMELWADRIMASGESRTISIWTAPDQPPQTRADLAIWVGGRPIGLLSVFDDGPRRFEPDELALLASAADQVGVMVETARLRQRVEQTAVMQERQRLARELHDSVTQLLYSLTLHAEAGHKAVEIGDFQRTLRYVGEIGDAARQALKEMRLLVHELRPPVLDESGLVGALRRRLDSVENRSGIAAQLEADDLPPLPAPVEEALYWIAQEALNNALKHSRALKVDVRLRTENQTVTLEVCDLGVGFDIRLASEGGGLGMANMRQRAERVGGRLSIDSSPGQGTTVTAIVNLPGIANAHRQRSSDS